MAIKIVLKVVLSFNVLRNFLSNIYGKRIYYQFTGFNNLFGQFLNVFLINCNSSNVNFLIFDNLKFSFNWSKLSTPINNPLIQWIDLTYEKHNYNNYTHFPRICQYVERAERLHAPSRTSRTRDSHAPSREKCLRHGVIHRPVRDVTYQITGKTCAT